MFDRTWEARDKIFYLIQIFASSGRVRRELCGDKTVIVSILRALKKGSAVCEVSIAKFPSSDPKATLTGKCIWSGKPKDFRLENLYGGDTLCQVKEQ